MLGDSIFERTAGNGLNESGFWSCTNMDVHSIKWLHAVDHPHNGHYGDLWPSLYVSSFEL